MTTRFTLGPPSQWFTLFQLFKVLQGINRDVSNVCTMKKIIRAPLTHFSSYSFLNLSLRRNVKVSKYINANPFQLWVMPYSDIYTI